MYAVRAFGKAGRTAGPVRQWRTGGTERPIPQLLCAGHRPSLLPLVCFHSCAPVILSPQHTRPPFLWMSRLVKWDGNVLRGPVSVWFESEMFQLPAGPPMSHPFNTNNWFMGVRNLKMPNSIETYSRVSFRLDQPKAVSLMLSPPCGTNNGAKLLRSVIILQSGETVRLQDHLAYVDPEQARLHQRAKSMFEMTVAPLHQFQLSHQPDTSPRASCDYWQGTYAAK